MGGSPLDHATLHGHGPQDRQHGAHTTRRREAAVREQAVVAERDAKSRQQIEDAKDDEVLPVERAAPCQPAGYDDRQQWSTCGKRLNRSFARFVLEGDRLRRTRSGGLLRVVIGHGLPASFVRSAHVPLVGPRTYHVVLLGRQAAPWLGRQARCRKAAEDTGYTSGSRLRGGVGFGLTGRQVMRQLGLVERQGSPPTSSS